MNISTTRVNKLRYSTRKVIEYLLYYIPPQGTRFFYKEPFLPFYFYFYHFYQFSMQISEWSKQNNAMFSPLNIHGDYSTLNNQGNIQQLLKYRDLS